MGSGGGAAVGGRRPGEELRVGATTMVDRLMRIAPTAGESVTPMKARAPAASGIANRLCPAPHARVWTILRDGFAVRKTG